MLNSSERANRNCSCGPNHFARVMDQCLEALRSSDESRFEEQETRPEPARSRGSVMKQNYQVHPAAGAQAQQDRKQAQAREGASATSIAIRSSGENTTKVEEKTDDERGKASEERNSLKTRLLLVEDNAVNMRVRRSSLFIV